MRTQSALTFEQLKGRKETLADILRKRGKPEQEESQKVLLVRHQIQNAQHNGYFLNYCCNDCYSELYCWDPAVPDQLLCPGCGWESAVSESATG